METKSKPIVVGLAVLLTIFLGFGFVVFIQNYKEAKETKRFYVVFPGSVQGLVNGSFVFYNGLNVGDVKTIELNPLKPSEVRVEIEVDALTPVRKDSRLTLSYQGVTGVAAIEITSGSEWNDLVETSEENPAYLFGESSGIQSLLDKAETSLAELGGILALTKIRLEAIDTKSINQIISNVQSFSLVLADSAPDVRNTIENVSQVSKDLRTTSDKIVNLLASLEDEQGDLVLAEDIKQTMASIRKAAETLDKQSVLISSDIRKFSGEGLRDLQNLIRQGEKTIREIETFVKTLERNPQQFIYGNKPVPSYKPR